ncbi:MAG: hypothetical protein EZS28_029914 [Streblomastix strix]|uniref:Uncharacterized protein n=1 Tax=Streblomastix strix TaxID=222440 RepID=A0A5J4UWM5_9EUKA|nr:MAG: hypothetical protein EZS28_029914 [Streblomastix strix]
MISSKDLAHAPFGWLEYLRFCSAQLTPITVDSVVGTIIDWTGKVIDAKQNPVIIQPNPTEQGISNPNILLFINERLGQYKYDLTPGKLLQFRAAIRKVSSDNPVELEALPRTAGFVPDITLSYAKFTAIYGRNALNSSELFFRQLFLGRQVVVIGSFGEYRDYSRGRGQYQALSFNLADDFCTDSCDSVLLIVHQQNKPILNSLQMYVSQTSSNGGEYEYEICAKFVERGDPHVLELSLITNRFNQTVFKSKQANF